MEKYKKVLKKDYEDWLAANADYREAVRKDPDRLHFHLMPPTGWMNDPNGLCQFHGVYHIYYQYTPFEPTGELKLWGHYTTRDFIHYKEEEPVLFPDTDADAHGVYSGSAFVEDDMIHYFYTGNVKCFDKDDYDYINSGRESNTIHVTSKDGYTFSSKEVLLSNQDYPEDMSCHIRDPKILKNKDDYYMVLGARSRNSIGEILMYHSKDLKNWEYYDRITTGEKFGYMWECPDLFVLEGEMFLISCPQGVEPHGLDFQNIHQCTTMKINYDFEHHTYDICDMNEIIMLDRGFDFYAPQTFEDESGRRILIGWMGIPDADYTNPTVDAGWQHALTIPRELHVQNGYIIQQPIKELEQLRIGKMESAIEHIGERHDLVYEAVIDFTTCKDMKMTVREGITLEYCDHILKLDLGKEGAGRTSRSVKLDQLDKLHLFVDTTSIEVFVNDGKEVFTSRIYGANGLVKIEGSCSGTAILYELAPFIM